MKTKWIVRKVLLETGWKTASARICTSFISIIAGSAICASADEPGQYFIGERGADQRVWNRVILETNLTGEIGLRTNSYIELETGMPYISPEVVVRTFLNPTDNHYHLFVINANASNYEDIPGWDGWSVVSWKQLHSTNFTDLNPLGVAGPEPIQTVTNSYTSGQPIRVLPISINHIELSP